MIDYGYFKYQDAVFNIYVGYGMFASWSYSPVASPVGTMGRYRCLLGVGV